MKRRTVLAGLAGVGVASGFLIGKQRDRCHDPVAHGIEYADGSLHDDGTVHGQFATDC